MTVNIIEYIANISQQLFEDTEGSVFIYLFIIYILLHAYVSHHKMHVCGRTLALCCHAEINSVMD